MKEGRGEWRGKKEAGQEEGAATQLNAQMALAPKVRQILRALIIGLTRKEQDLDALSPWRPTPLVSATPLGREDNAPLLCGTDKSAGCSLAILKLAEFRWQS